MFEKALKQDTSKIIVGEVVGKEISPSFYKPLDNGSGGSNTDFR